MDPGQQASAAEGVQPQGRTEASDDPPVTSRLFVTGLDMDDEDRLVAIRSTVSALQKVRFLSPLAPDCNAQLLNLNVAGGRGGEQAASAESSCTEVAGPSGPGEHPIVPVVLILLSLKKSKVQCCVMQYMCNLGKAEDTVAALQTERDAATKVT